MILERRPGSVLSSYEGIRKTSLDRPKSGTPEKWDGCNTEELGLMFDTFRQVTLTVSSFYKQVRLDFFCLSLVLFVITVKSEH